MAIVPLNFVLQKDRDLQRSELAIADLHTAYTDVLNAADAVIIPTYISWQDVDAAGGEEDVSREERSEMQSKMAALFPDRYEDTARFRNAATRLRLVIPANDAWIISDLADSLNPLIAYITTSADNGVVPRSPDDLLRNYTDAKVELVNEFRSDALGQDPLNDTESIRMYGETYQNIIQEFTFRDANPADEITVGDTEQYRLFKDPRTEQ